MSTNLSLNTADIVTLILIMLLCAFAVRIVIGFFRTPRPKESRRKNSTSGTEPAASENNPLHPGLIRLTVNVDGMHCGMCEANVNDMIRRDFNVKKVRSSHIQGTTVILTDKDIDDSEIEASIGKAGYRALNVKREAIS